MQFDSNFFLKSTHDSKFILLVAAHKGEITFFLQKQGTRWNKYEFLKYRLFVDLENRKMILLTGEGSWKSLHALSSLLSQLSQKFLYVFNIGFAASLDSDIDFAKVIDIRTCYASPAPGFFEFQSFTLDEHASPTTSLDLISCGYRVLSPKLHAPLKAYASVVDRELWGLCFAAKDFSVPVYSTKIISDFASENVCDKVLNQSEMLSQRLEEQVEHRIQNLNIGSSNPFSSNKIKEEDFAQCFNFHFTVSTRLKFNRLCKVLSIKHKLEDASFYPWFRDCFLKDYLQTEGLKLNKIQLKKVMNEMETYLGKQFKFDFTDEIHHV